MFGKITKALEGIRNELIPIKNALRVLSDAPQESPLYESVAERLSTLEGRLELALGQMAGETVKQESLKGAARASEERARGHLQRAEKALEVAQGDSGGEDVDPFEQAGRAYADAIAAGGNGEALEPLSAVPSFVDPRQESLAFARRTKRA